MLIWSCWFWWLYFYWNFSYPCLYTIWDNSVFSPISSANYIARPSWTQSNPINLAWSKSHFCSVIIKTERIDEYHKWTKNVDKSNSKQLIKWYQQKHNGNEMKSKNVLIHTYYSASIRYQTNQRSKLYFLKGLKNL